MVSKVSRNNGSGNVIVRRILTSNDCLALNPPGSTTVIVNVTTPEAVDAGMIEKLRLFPVPPKRTFCGGIND